MELKEQRIFTVQDIAKAYTEGYRDGFNHVYRDGLVRDNGNSTHYE
jgi:hypothetical protein